MPTRPPRVLSISPPDPEGASRWVERSPALAASSHVGLLLRLTVDREPSVEAWVDRLEATGATVILHARTPDGAGLAVERAIGLHLPSSADPSVWRPRIQGLLGISCHGRADLERAAGICDYATLSPVFPPCSKPNDARPTLGLEGLARAVEGLEIPVLALGGLALGRASACIQAGASGVAGIGAFGDPEALAAMAREVASCRPKP
jgi:thiamine-phosphate pyrophosphorylase